MKLRIILLALMMSIILMACDSKKPMQLDIPNNLKIENKILSFDVVENALKYRIEVIDKETQTSRKIFVEENQNLDLLYLIPASYAIKIQAVGDSKMYLDSEFSESIDYVQNDPNQVNEIKAEFLLDPIKVKWLGRNSYQTATKANFFHFTASGFEVKFHGTELQAELITGTNAVGKEPHLVVLIDGETNPEDGTLIVMDATKKVYTLASGLEEGVHTVRVLKRSESIDSSTGLSQIITDGYFVNVDPLKTRKIEVIAASSSAGFGNLASNTNEPKTTQNSDGLRAYAYLAARMVNAEINIFSASGWPLLKGPWTGDNNIPTAYDYVNVYSSVKWNHSAYEPDVIIINLGTNDWSYITTLQTDKKTQAILAFEEAYVDFIERINDLHPNASIVIAYGLMNETNVYQPTLNVVQKAQQALPGANIYSIQLPSVNALEGIGSSNHPSLPTHIRAAQMLADQLVIWQQWDIVYQNIDGE